MGHFQREIITKVLPFKFTLKKSLILTCYHNHPFHRADDVDHTRKATTTHSNSNTHTRYLQHTEVDSDG